MSDGSSDFDFDSGQAPPARDEALRMIGNLGLTARLGVRARGFECNRLI